MKTWVISGPVDEGGVKSAFVVKTTSQVKSYRDLSRRLEQACLQASKATGQHLNGYDLLSMLEARPGSVMEYLSPFGILSAEDAKGRRPTFFGVHTLVLAWFCLGFALMTTELATAPFVLTVFAVLVFWDAMTDMADRRLHCLLWPFGTAAVLTYCSLILYIAYTIHEAGFSGQSLPLQVSIGVASVVFLAMVLGGELFAPTKSWVVIQVFTVISLLLLAGATSNTSGVKFYYNGQHIQPFEQIERP